MKSIVDKLSSRLEKVENGGGQSGTTSGLDEDAVKQLIKDTDPKDHEHEIDDIEGLDTTFATKDHTHMSSDISDFKTQVQTVINDTTVPSHTHEIGDIQGLDTSIFATKEELSNQTHTCSQIRDLDSKLSGYASKEHTHEVGQITGLDTKFATKDELSGYASSSHTHDEITNRISETINDDNKTNLVTGTAVMNYVNEKIPELKTVEGDIDLDETIFYIPLCFEDESFECKIAINYRSSILMYIPIKCIELSWDFPKGYYKINGYNHLQSLGSGDSFKGTGIYVFLDTISKKYCVCLKLEITQLNDDIHYKISSYQNIISLDDVSLLTGSSRIYMNLVEYDF